MREQKEHVGRAGAAYLLPLLMLVCVIALCFSVGRTYAVITEATNVVVNTFYGESASEEPGDTGETEEPETEEPETEEPETVEPETDDSGTTETEEADTAGTDTGESAKTGDESNILIWVIIAAAALAGIVIIGIKMLKDKKQTD